MKIRAASGPYYAMGSTVWCRDPKRQHESTGLFAGEGFPICLVQLQVVDKEDYARCIADALNRLEPSRDPVPGRVVPFIRKGD